MKRKGLAPASLNVYALRVPKFIIVCSPQQPGQTHEDFCLTVRHAATTLLSEAPDGLKLSMTKQMPPRFSIPILLRRPVALISIWQDEPPTLQQRSTLGALGMVQHGYRVSESAPVKRARCWPDGERSPGVLLLTLFRKRPDLSRETFIERWHGEHTPLAIAIHPLVHYERNLVEDRLGDAALPLDGIVEEHVSDARDVLLPQRFFGGALPMLPNMIRVGLHSRTFLQLSTVQNYLMSEYWLRTPWGLAGEH